MLEYKTVWDENAKSLPCKRDVFMGISIHITLLNMETTCGYIVFKTWRYTMSCYKIY